MTVLAALVVALAVVAGTFLVALWLGSAAYVYQRQVKRDDVRRADPIARVLFPARYESPFPWHQRKQRDAQSRIA